DPRNPRGLLLSEPGRRRRGIPAHDRKLATPTVQEPHSVDGAFQTMITYNYLPGVQVATIDRGLAALRVPQCKSTLIVGTSATGPGNSPYQVVDRASAATLFGIGGTL